MENYGNAGCANYFSKSVFEWLVLLLGMQTCLTLSLI